LTRERPGPQAKGDRWRGVGLAVLFAAPVGVGVALATLRSTGRPPTDPLVVGAGLVAGAALFALVVLAHCTGANAP
jgi:hypothetical protein